MITLVQNILDILTRRLPAELYEPIYIAGFLGLATICFTGVKKEKKTLFIILSAIVIIVLERALLYSKMSSRRYFEILLIPFFFFSAHGCNCLTILEKSFLKKKIHKNVFSVSASVLLLILLGFEIGKTQRSDFYTYTKLQCYEKYAKNESLINPAYLFFDDAHETNRMKYYSPIDPKSISVMNKGETNPFSFFRNTPNLLYYKNVLLLSENDSKQLSGNTTIPINGFNYPRQICRVFTSQKKKRFIAGYLYSPNAENKPAVDPILVRGKNEYTISPDSIAFPRNATITYNGLNPVISGQRSAIFSKDYIPVPENNSLHLIVNVKNAGNTSLHLFIGYAFYDQNKKIIWGSCYPGNNINTIIKVVSAKKTDSYITVDSPPEQWKAGWRIAIDAKEDRSDVPNMNILSSAVLDIELLSDGNTKIILKKPLERDIPTGTPVRLHGPSDAYIYQYIKKISPGEDVQFSSYIAKYESYTFYSPVAIPKGVYFIRPLILSYSIDDAPNSIEISDWTLTY